jgi:D-glycero-alpha-D-manno-heptose-7-phosphate kinase
VVLIISKTAVRIGIAGGGSDYPEFYIQNSGAVITSTINKYSYIFLRYLPPFFEHKNRIVYSKIELPQTFDEINHPSARECLKFLNIDRGVEIHHAGDLPARSGIGSSSAFTVGLLHALHTLKGQHIDKYELALEAIHVEQDLIKEHVGCQDQLSTSIGGFNYIKLGNHAPIVKTLNISEDRIKLLESCLMLVFTGFPHMASEIAKTYNFKEREAEIKEIMGYTKDVYDILTCGNILDYGKILHQTWTLKKRVSTKISTPYIDFIYNEALRLGAIGGRQLGAGGGGFFVLFCEPDKQIMLRNSDTFKNMLFVPFSFERNDKCGSRIVSSNGE